MEIKAFKSPNKQFLYSSTLFTLPGKISLSSSSPSPSSSSSSQNHHCHDHHKVTIITIAIIIIIIVTIVIRRGLYGTLIVTSDECHIEDDNNNELSTVDYAGVIATFMHPCIHAFMQPRMHSLRTIRPMADRARS